jgi:membrane protein YdbS with pleckstrin-like domain
MDTERVVQAPPYTTEALAVPTPDALYPQGMPTPRGTTLAGAPSTAESAVEERGIGVEGETVIWEGRYALRNFIGRLVGAVILTLAWAALALWAWSGQNLNYSIAAVVTGVAVLVIWLALAWRMLMARLGHFYRLTNRRLFVSTGVFNRRRDQMELLRIQDVYTKQGLIQRFLSIGTVVVVSSEPHFPVMYLAGVDEPKRVMDLIWHHARAERDLRSVKVDQI